MKVSIVSDIHSEKPTYSEDNLINALIEDGDILILAGDIGTLEEPEKLIKTLRLVQSKYKIILYIPGNHEYDGPLELSATDSKLRGLCDYLNRVRLNRDGSIYFMNEESIILDFGGKKIKVIGATLWTRPYDINGKELRDTYVLSLTNKKRNEIFEQHCEYISKETGYPSAETSETWVITHHAPSFKLLEDGEGTTEEHRNAQTYYASHCEYLYKGVDRWIFGHTHTRTEESAGIKLYNNPIGYDSDNIEPTPMTFTI